MFLWAVLVQIVVKGALGKRLEPSVHCLGQLPTYGSATSTKQNHARPPTHPPTHAPTLPPTHELTHARTHSPTHPHTHSPTHTHAPTRPPTPPTHALTRPLTHPRTHPPTHPPTHARQHVPCPRKRLILLEPQSRYRSQATEAPAFLSLGLLLPVHTCWQPRSPR